MSYEYFGADYASRDLATANTNLAVAASACATAARHPENVLLDGRDAVAVLRDRLKVYRRMRDRVLAIQPHVLVAGGSHAPVPFTPSNVIDPDGE